MAITFASLPYGETGKKAGNAVLVKTTAGEAVDLFTVYGAGIGAPTGRVTSAYFDQTACDWLSRMVKTLVGLTPSFPAVSALINQVVQAASLGGSEPLVDFVTVGDDGVIRVLGAPGADREFIATVQHSLPGGVTASPAPFLINNPAAVLVPSSSGSTNPGSAPGLISPVWTLIRSFSAAAAGASDDIEIFGPVSGTAPFKFSIVGFSAIIKTASGGGAKTLQLRSAAGGGGTARSTIVSSAATGIATAGQDGSVAVTTGLGVPPTDPTDIVVNAGDNLYIRRDERDCAGEVILLLAAGY